MKLRIAKGCIVIMPVIGILGLFIFTFIGEIMYGWGLFVIMLLLSGIFESDIFQVPALWESNSCKCHIEPEILPIVW